MGTLPRPDGPIQPDAAEADLVEQRRLAEDDEEQDDVDARLLASPALEADAVDVAEQSRPAPHLADDAER